MSILLDRIMVISDLDGTLLDSETYSSTAAGPALEALKEKGACLVLASSKTRAELEPIRSRLGHDGPFIVENGGALYVPIGFFRVPLEGAIARETYEIIEFGTPYAQLRAALKEIAGTLGIQMKGFGDMTIEEVAERTGLTHNEATLAKQREYDEPFVLSNDAFIESVRREAAVRGLACTRGGRFYHLLGANNKGTACRLLIQHCRRQFAASQGRLYTIGIGDSANDLPMLAAVDQPILVQKPDGSYDPAGQLQHVLYAPGIGPAGWNAAVLHVLKSL
jgi:mannosyl-3-phosphoglycerate phosphatase